MPATTPRRRYQDIAVILRQQITVGTYDVGARMAPERVIAQELEVSRSLVREAMIMLEIEGLIEVRQGSGSYVKARPGPRENAIEKPEYEDIGPFELLQARQLLESNVAAFAATTITKADIIRLREALAEERRNLEAHNDSYSGDETFHLLIAKSTQNTVLAETVEHVWQRRNSSQMWLKLHERISSSNYRSAWLTDHENILNALQRRDPAAAKAAMWQHLENVRNTLLELSDPQDPRFDAYLFDQDTVLA
ncbi:FCD domain-containing protein [Polycladidibacter hongkongensis]|uniref:FCD domain-containing protein n=1 Tax=Polycladidibacter hongkongensis TaxID=1647556 RepID=UPI00082E454D|nr:FCD domain-containing protein [Pseudovibrio hongkongensis]